MDDEVLQRARALVMAMNTISSVQESHLPRHITENHSSPIQSPVKNGSSISVQIGDSYKGAAITGSTLVTTFTDIRPFLERGSVIYIDGTECRVSTGGEWTANRIELAHDFLGVTNFDAQITLSVAKKGVKTLVKRSPRPIAGNIISQAVEGLDDLAKQYKSKG